MLERVFQKKVIQYIKSSGGYVVNFNPTAVGGGGVSDLLCSINGIFVAIELKTTSALKQRQALNLKKVNESGGVGIVLLESKDWKRTIDELFSHSEECCVVDYCMMVLSHIDIDEFLNKVNWEE